MPTRSITATHLARNFSDLLNQVRYQQVTLKVMRGNEPVAFVTPVPVATGYPIAQLDRLLSGLPRLSNEESQQFLDDIHCGVTELSLEHDSWVS